jgi:hypothetical protein
MQPVLEPGFHLCVHQVTRSTVAAAANIQVTAGSDIARFFDAQCKKLQWLPLMEI